MQVREIMEIKQNLHLGDCLERLDELDVESVDLVYIDPPFFTQKDHMSKNKLGDKEFRFSDVWDSPESYAGFLCERLMKVKPVLKETGSIFFHCDKSGSHLARAVMDKVFGTGNFQSEIIWHFRRWSNSKKGLLGAHQNILFYAKSDNFKFNKVYQDYSLTTNVDQIMQKRSRDGRNKSVYARDENGNILNGGSKKGVPLSDVWEIPFLNPKAKERVGYPTQKPVSLLKRIIEISTDEGDVILDPFCGSGTTLVAAKLMQRNSIGIDSSEDAIKLAENRLNSPMETESNLLKNGIGSYYGHCEEASSFLTGVDYTPVHRNKGIDGLLKQEVNGLPAFVRVQRQGETTLEAVEAIKKASRNKGACELIVFATKPDLLPFEDNPDVKVILTPSYALSNMIGNA